VKTLLCAVVTIATLGAFAVAQGVDESAAMSSQNTQPLGGGLCNSGVFYGGNMGVPKYGFNNGNTLFFPLAATYGAVTLPHGTQTLHGICFNTTTNSTSAPTLDPLLATWDIRIGVTPGNGGTEVATGTGKVTITRTGRFLGLFPEYSIWVYFGTPINILGPVTIWVNESPQCTTSNPTCSSEQFYVDNSTGAGSLHGAAQPVGMIFYNSPAHGATWQNWCTIPPVTTAECQRLSFGLF